jgi:N-acetylmuramic acid 6-phosphate etherase
MAEFIRITEQESKYNHLEKMSINELLSNINKEDSLVSDAVQKVIPQIEALVDVIVDHMLQGGRLFYIGAGTSGRLAVVDASECPPTYGVPYGLVNAIIAGGKDAITQAVENAEDDTQQAWMDLQEHDISAKDVVIGIAASGTTPYVIGALEACNQHQITTGSICCNNHAPLSKVAKFPIEVIVGPEFVTGSTRMKSGTAQKLILNMISTSVMIQLGRVEDNKMVNMQLTNEKLVDRGVIMLMKQLAITDYNQAKDILLQYGSVKKAVEQYTIAS